MDLSLPIDRINANEVSRTFFRNNYLQPSKPLILKNFSSLFPAGKLWTFDYFREKIGDFKVGIIDNRIKTETAYTKPHLYMPFREFLNTIERDEETPYRIFLFNLYKEFPELRKDFPTPELISGILGNLSYSFFGGKNSEVRFHYDIDCSGVLMTQVIGRKKVILIAPEFDRLIYKVPFTSFSLINPEKPDYDLFPAIKHVKGYDFILDPGDALFMPSRFWHCNTYLDGGMALSYRMLASHPGDIYRGIMNTTLRLFFDKSMYKLMDGQWMEMKKKKAMFLAGKN